MLYAIIAAVVCGLDQLTKYLISSSLDWHEYVDVLPGVLQLTRCANTGGAFSMLSDYTWALTAVSVVCIALFLVLLTRKWLDGGEKAALAMVLGGALGNAIDRILYGQVVDMFVFVPTGLSVFNVADVFICVGGGLFCLLYLIKILKEDRFHHPALKGGEMPELKRLRSRPRLAEDGEDHEDNG
jgi:signal peptidase II